MICLKIDIQKAQFLRLFIIVVFLSGIKVYGQPISFNFTSPRPDAQYISPQQSIILKTGYQFDSNTIPKCDITIIGSLSNNHSVNWKLSKDLKTLVFISDKQFAYGETVLVYISDGLKTLGDNNISGISFKFNIMPQDNLPFLIEFYKRQSSNNNPNSNRTNASPITKNKKSSNSIPDDYPSPEMINYNETDDGYLFFSLSPRAGAPQFNNYLSINDKYGIPLFFKKSQNNTLNFHQMPDGRLAYARNDYGFPENEKYFIMDSSYVIIDSVKTGNGYNMDGHDMLLLENGNYLLISYDPQPVDMSQIIIGGNPNAIVVGLIIQEVDVNQTVFFQWRSWDHFEITDATEDINLFGSYIDYVHGNAFAFDQDGNLLISSRHLDEITKINYQTGDIIYRFGLLAKNNEFTLIDDYSGFSHQHDVRVMQNGNITIFDNGNLHPFQYSRALEYSINETNKTATLVWYYRNDPDIYGSATGSYRRDKDGKNLIGWGSTWPIAASEILPNQSKSFEVYLPDGVYSYRTLKSHWSTNLFKTPQDLHFGNYQGITEPKMMIFPIFNNSDDKIWITSVHLHDDLFNIADNLPLLVPANDTVVITISYQPNSQGTFSDRLTLNYDNFSPQTGTVRIARQLTLNGDWDESLPTVSFLPKFGSTDVSPDSDIIVSFSEPIRKEGGALISDTDIPDLFIFKRSHQWGNNIEFTGTISIDRMQITINATEQLNELTAYYLELKQSTIEDDDANVISFPETTYFTTGLLVDNEKINNSDEIFIYPSPMENSLAIKLPKNSIFDIGIYDIQGRKWYEELYAKGIINIDTKQYPNGIYLVHIIDESGKTKIRKVVKSNCSK